MKQNISKLQWVVLILFGALLLKEFYDYALLMIDLLGKNEIMSPLSLWLIPLVTDLIGIYGLFLITKFRKLGFWLFYLSYFTSMFFDFERGIGPSGKVITIIGNLVILLVFFFPTKKIFKVSR